MIDLDLRYSNVSGLATVIGGLYDTATSTVDEPALAEASGRDPRRVSFALRRTGASRQRISVLTKRLSNDQDEEQHTTCHVT